MPKSVSEAPALEEREAPLRRRLHNAARDRAPAHQRARLLAGLQRRVTREAKLELAAQAVVEVLRARRGALIRGVQLADTRADAHEEVLGELLLGTDARRPED